MSGKMDRKSTFFNTGAREAHFCSRFEGNGNCVDCGGMTPLWLHASNAQARSPL